MPGATRGSANATTWRSPARSHRCRYWSNSACRSSAQGGRLVAPRRGDLEAELRAARTAIRELGGDNGRIVPVQAAGLDDGRALVVVEKVRHTPGRYPRRAGIPERNPIGAPDGA